MNDDISSYLNYIKYLSKHISTSFSNIEKVDINENYNRQELKLKVDEIANISDNLSLKISDLHSILSLSELRNRKISKLGI